MPVNFSDVCRLCGQKKKIKIDLFSNGCQLTQKIYSSLSLKITQEDMLPKVICFECQRHVENYYSFRVKCHRVQLKLQKLSLQGATKVVPGIKEESPEVEAPESVPAHNDAINHTDHTYFAHTPPTVPRLPPRVKVEAEDDHQDQEDDSELPQIISESINNDNPFLEVKEPIVEIIMDNEELSDPQTCSKIEADVLHYETKPLIVDCIEDNDSAGVTVEDGSGEINADTTEQEVEADDIIKGQGTACVIDCENIDDKHLSHADVDNGGHDEQPRVDNLEVQVSGSLSGWGNADDKYWPIVDVGNHKQDVQLWNDDIEAEVTGNLIDWVNIDGKDMPVADTGTSHEVDPGCNEPMEHNAVNQIDWENIDDKYLSLADGEECNIDIEEIEALIRKKENPAVRFQCNICNRSFKFFKAMRKHRQSHEGEQDSYTCDFCVENDQSSRQFSTLKYLKNHIFRKHLSKERFSCGQCGEKFRTRTAFNEHVQRLHGPAVRSCRECSKQFKNKRLLREHQRCHSMVRPYICEICGRDFRWPNVLRSHLQTHSARENFLCAECGKKFSTKKNMQEHSNVHRGIRPFVCAQCGVSFSYMSSLSRHAVLHRKARHKCGTCEREFAQLSLLREHESSHAGRLPLSCPVCSRSFATRSNLCNHLKIHGEKAFKCDVCDMKFVRRGNLHDHMVRHNGARHVCPAPSCNKSFSQRTPLSSHFRKKHPELALGRRPGVTHVESQQIGSNLVQKIQYYWWQKQPNVIDLETA